RRRPVFVDAWALTALTNRSDSWHLMALRWSDVLEREHRALVTTDWVLGEFLGNLAKPPFRKLAVYRVLRLQQSSYVQIVAATRREWEEGFFLYRSRPDKAWSLVDCISILVCQRFKITEVFTGDH